MGQLWRTITRGASVLVDLVLPTVCGGCGIGGEGQLCRVCALGLAGLEPVPARPTPAPAGLPGCVAVGGYEGPLRGLILAYKERQAHRLAAPLGGHLGRAVAVCAGRRGVALVLVPVPATASAVRERHGDHVLRLARYCVRVVRRQGHPAVIVACLAARPKADSSTLSSAERARAAEAAFRPRPAALRRVAAAQRRGAKVIVLDDVMTTGATLAAVTHVLARAGVRVDGAATVAATRRRYPSPERGSTEGLNRDANFLSRSGVTAAGWGNPALRSSLPGVT